MYLSKIVLKNFRQFSEDEPLEVEFQPGVVALAGPNDSGKTAIIDAIRYLLTTRDQEYSPYLVDDYYIDPEGKQTTKFTIDTVFDDLSEKDIAQYLEYLTYPLDSEGNRFPDAQHPTLHLRLQVEKKEKGTRTWNDAKVFSGVDGNGKIVDSDTRRLLACTYLRPLRDAEREMSSGRNSRLSQVLKQFPEINYGNSVDDEKLPSSEKQLQELSLSGLSDLLKILINKNKGVEAAKNALNRDHLSNLILKDDSIAGEFNFVSGTTDDAKLRQVLERLELTLKGGKTQSDQGRFGLGSNNLLFIACELLLIAKDNVGFPLLLIEEPEAHLHPQRQLQLLEYLLSKAEGHPNIQVIISTHSPVLASKVKVENIVLVNHGKAYSLAKGKTKLSNKDYSFLSRFLDATKSNLFFAENLIIVEGDAEELLLPTIARLIGHDLTKAGVSIVNVGGIGLRRYSKILQRVNEEESIGIRVANITDRDLVPEKIVGRFGFERDEDIEKDENSKRKWRSENDPKFGLLLANAASSNNIEIGRNRYLFKKSEDDGQFVKTFVSDQWTFEYDLAFAGLAEEVFIAAKLAIADEKLHTSSDYQTEYSKAHDDARSNFRKLRERGHDNEELAILAYAPFISGRKASKSIAAQYLSDILVARFKISDNDEALESRLPTYLVEAIKYTTNV